MNRSFHIHTAVLVVVACVAPHSTAGDDPKPVIVTKPRIRMSHSTFVSAVAFSPDGKLLASASNSASHDGVVIWDAATGKGLAKLPSDRTLHALAFSPDGKTLAYGGDSKQIHLADVEMGKVRTSIKKDLGAGTRLSLCFSPDGKVLAWGGGYFYDLEAGKEKDRWKRIGTRAVRFSPDGKLFASGDYGVQITEVATRKDLVSFKPPEITRLDRHRVQPGRQDAGIVGGRGRAAVGRRYRQAASDARPGWLR